MIRSPSSALARTSATAGAATALTPRPPAAATKRSSGTCVELADVARHLEEGVEPGALARPERVAELLEVAREVAGRIAVARARLAREHLRLGPREAHRRDQRVLELGDALGDRLRRRPDREHHRQTRPLEPEPAEVVVRGRILERAPQRRVADQQLRVGLLARAARATTCGSSTFVSTTEVALSGVTAIERICGERHARDELDRVDRALRRDAQPRQDPQRRRVPRVLDRRDRREVELAVERASGSSSVGTPWISSTSAFSRWKTGAMFTYEMRPRRITRGSSPRPSRMGSGLAMRQT